MSFAHRVQRYAESPVHAQGASIAWLRDRLATLAPRHVVDLACGAGHGTLRTAPAHARLTAVDAAWTMLVEYERRARLAGFAGVTLRHGSAEVVELADASADAVVCRLGIHHVPNLAAALAEVARILKPGGTFLLVEHYTGATENDRRAMAELLHLHDTSHVHTLLPKSYAAIAAHHGLTLEAVKAPVSEVSGVLPLEHWLDLGGAPAPNRAMLRTCLAAMAPARQNALGFVTYDGVLCFDVPVALFSFVKEG